MEYIQCRRNLCIPVSWNKECGLNQSVILAFRVVILEHSVTTFFWKIFPNSELSMTRPNFDNITLTRPELTLVLSLTYGCWWILFYADWLDITLVHYYQAMHKYDCLRCTLLIWDRLVFLLHRKGHSLRRLRR